MNQLEKRIESLSGRARDALERQLAAAERTHAPNTVRSRLVAYVTTNDALFFDRDDVRHFAAERLPEWMVPEIVLLDALPLSPNGKVDVEALPEPGDLFAGSAEYVPPRTDVQRTICGIWESVMGSARIGIQDNFFEIGGDSILSIQIVARMRQAGFRVAPDQLFRHQSISELAAVVELEDEPRQNSMEDGVAPDDPTPDDVPLTPIQFWFFEQSFERPEHWHQAVRINVPGHVEASDLERAMAEVARRHDVFRLTFRRSEDGWRSACVDDSSIDVVLSKGTRSPAGLAEAPLLVAALTADGQGGRTLHLSIHHLIIDPISWQILLEDLETAYNAVVAGHSPQFPRPSSSFRDWAGAIRRLTESRSLDNELAFWTAQVDGFAGQPLFHGTDATEADAKTVEGRLDTEDTRRLLDGANGAYGTRTEDLLLAALVRTMAARFGPSDLPVGLERHGREEIGGALDLSRSVGWFAAYFPLVLPGTGDLSPARLIPAVKECVRSVPTGGLGFGALRYLHPDTDVRDRLGGAGMPDILFNYSGRIDSLSARNGRFEVLGSIFGDRAERNHLSHALEINSFVEDGHLVTLWKTGGDTLGGRSVASMMEQFIQELRDLVEHCLAPGTGHATPSDFPDADLTQEQLDRLLGKR